MDEISFHRKPLGGSSRKFYFDVLVNGVSLERLIEVAYSKKNEEARTGIFTAGFTYSMLPYSVQQNDNHINDWKESVKAKINALCRPNNEIHRSSILVCSECADVGCGQISARIERVNNVIRWGEFGYRTTDTEIQDGHVLASLTFSFKEEAYTRAFEGLLALILNENENMP